MTGTTQFFEVSDDPMPLSEDQEVEEIAERIETAFLKNAMPTVSFPDAPATGSTEVRYGDLVTRPGGDPEAAADNTLQFKGNWRGVPGTFVCSACTATEKISVSATLNVKGQEEQSLIFGGANRDWVFQPANVKATVMKADGDYLWFGWWHDVPKKPGTPDKPSTHAFRTFAGGSQVFTTATGGDTITPLEGNATFEGAATGKYAQQGGTLLNPTFSADLFTARATLTAKFGKDEAAGAIEGEITDFYNGAGRHLAGWEVTLKPINLGSEPGQGNAIDDAMFESPNENVTTLVEEVDDGLDERITAVADISGTESSSGSWSGGFYGNGRTDGEPGSVAGEFRADYGTYDSTTGGSTAVHTSIAGAFGAHNTSADE